jgi:glycosidase
MRKIKIILLLLISIFTLVGCKEDERPISFSVTNGESLTQFVGEETIILDSITVYDFDGMNLTPFIEVSGSYDLYSVGVYEITLTVEDNYQIEATVSIILNIVELTCEMDNTQDKCQIHVSEINFKPETNLVTTIFVGDFIKLKWDILPIDATNQEITISSSDESIATVSSYGYIFTHTEGEVVITVTTVDGEHSISKTIEVIGKSCLDDPFQEKCAAEILSDTSRLTTVASPNISGLDYSTVYVNNKIYYEIYVRTFADSDNNNIGDFQGIIDNLPYLKSLGIGGIWLMPITDSRSDHGYEVDDYFDVDSEYGTMIEFKELVSTANNMGIDIIIDLVVNHMGAHNDIFQNVLQNGVNSDYYDWFTWIDNDDPRVSLKGSWGQTIWYNPTSRIWLKDGSYTIHSSLSDKMFCAYFSDWMPDLNLQNPEVISYIYSVGEFWLNDVGIQGFRMDATSHLFGHNEYDNIPDRVQSNIDFLTDFKDYLETVYSDVYIVAEAWEGYTEYSKYYSADISMFNFQANYSIKDAVNGYLSSDIGSVLNNVYNEIYQYNNNFIDAVFISNHDMDRIAKTVGDDNDVRMAAEILLTLPGNPYIYYGDEIGMLGMRTNMVWGDYYDSLSTNYDDRDIGEVDDQLLDSDSLLNTYIALGQTRISSLALMYGDFIPYNDSSFEGYYRIFENGDDKELVIVLFNFSSIYYKPIPEEFTSYEILYSTFDNNFGGVSPNGTIILRLPYSLKDTLIN